MGWVEGRIQRRRSCWECDSVEFVSDGADGVTYEGGGEENYCCCTEEINTQWLCHLVGPVNGFAKYSCTVMVLLIMGRSMLGLDIGLQTRAIKVAY